LRLILPSDTDFTTMSRILLSSIDGLLLQKLLGVEPASLDRVSRLFSGGLREHESADS
jgi:hypothetical protein